MSKSFNNCIYLNDNAKDVFGKVMSISDETMHEWYTLFFDSYNPEEHPMKLKKALAVEITDMIWGKGSGEKEKLAFESVSSGSFPEDIKDFTYDEKYDTISTISSISKSSKSDARRLILGGGVSVSKDGTTLNKVGVDTKLEVGDIVKVGKRVWVKLI